MTAVKKASQSVKNIVGISVVGPPVGNIKYFEEKGMQLEVQSSILGFECTFSLDGSV